MTDPRLLERETGYNFASELTLRGYQDTSAGSMCHCFPLRCDSSSTRTNDISEAAELG